MVFKKTICSFFCRKNIFESQVKKLLIQNIIGPTFKFQITSKIQDKVKIIKIHAEESQSLGMTKFTDLVEIKVQ